MLVGIGKPTHRPSLGIGQARQRRSTTLSLNPGTRSSRMRSMCRRQRMASGRSTGQTLPGATVRFGWWCMPPQFISSPGRCLSIVGACHRSWPAPLPTGAHYVSSSTCYAPCQPLTSCTQKIPPLISDNEGRPPPQGALSTAADGYARIADLLTDSDRAYPLATPRPTAPHATSSHQADVVTQKTAHWGVCGDLQWSCPAWLGIEGSNRHRGNCRGQMAHPPRTHRSLCIAGEDAGRLGVERTGPRYAKIGRHVRYRLSDVIDWKGMRFNESKSSSA